MPRVRPPLGAGNPPEAQGSPNEQATQAAAEGDIAPTLIEPKLSTPASIPPTPPDLAPLWSKVIRAEGISPLLRAVLINSSLTSFNSGKATIACLPRYANDANKRWRPNIAELLAKESAATTPIEVLITGAPSVQPQPTAAPTPSTDSDPTTPEIAAAPLPTSPSTPLTNPSTHPLVQTAIELFGGRIVDIQPRKR